MLPGATDAMRTAFSRLMRTGPALTRTVHAPFLRMRSCDTAPVRRHIAGTWPWGTQSTRRPWPNLSAAMNRHPDRAPKSLTTRTPRGDIGAQPT